MIMCKVRLFSIMCLLVCQVYEFDISKREYTAWSRDNSQKFPIQWLKQRGTLRYVACPEGDSSHLILNSEHDILVIDRSQVMSFFLVLFCYWRSREHMFTENVAHVILQTMHILKILIGHSLENAREKLPSLQSKQTRSRRG